MNLPTADANDLLATRQKLREGVGTATSELETSLERLSGPDCQHAFLLPMAQQARREASRPGLSALPLAGLSFSVKDLFDVAGQVTLAGSKVLAERPAATHDAPAVARLRAAGGVLIGRTNMTEFAFSAIGVNPHYGTPAAWDGRYQCAVRSPDDQGPCVPGGSSSGAAVSVATGAAFVGLGSDTGGSIRIPAALNGIVGFKSTARLVPRDGAIPLSSTLDTVCAVTRSVRDAILVHEVLAARRVAVDPRPLAQLRLAVVGTTFLDALDPVVAAAFERSVRLLSAAGAELVDIALPELEALRDLQAMGGFTAAESYAWHRKLLQRSGQGSADLAYDPRVRFRIERGAGILAWEYIDLIEARGRWIETIAGALHGFDAVLSPTVPIVAPSLASVAPGAERDEHFFRANSQLLRNTSVINMLDACAISIPCHEPGEMPVGLMLWHGAGHDDRLLSLALHVERILFGQ